LLTKYNGKVDHIAFYDTFKKEDKSNMKLFFEMKMEVDTLDEDCAESIMKLFKVINEVEHTPVLENVSIENRAKYHSKKEDEKKKEELGTVEKKRTDKELDLYMKRKQKKHTKIMK